MDLAVLTVLDLHSLEASVLSDTESPHALSEDLLTSTGGVDSIASSAGTIAAEVLDETGPIASDEVRAWTIRAPAKCKKT